MSYPPFNIFITLQCRGKIECSVAESCVLLKYIPFKTVREFLMNPGEKDALSNAKVSLKTDTFLLILTLKCLKNGQNIFFYYFYTKFRQTLTYKQ